VLALAIHNFGILGRLWGEVIENTDDDSATHLYGSGLSRTSVYATSILPRSLNRFLIYFFYRWETCIKDATVLGMLGLLTLGKLIMLSKGFFWDRMLFYVLLGSCFILVMDLSSTWLRKRLR
jgi:phosphonate transport system permease protein